MPDEHGDLPVNPADLGDPDDTPIGRAVTAYLAGDPVPAHQLSAEERALVLDVGPLLAGLRAPRPAAVQPPRPAVPDLDQDPIAIALGLVADPNRRLHADRLRAARRRARLQVSELAQRLSARGWEITTKDVATWERADTVQPPALVDAIGQILHTPPVTLMPTGSATRDTSLSRILDDDAIAQQLAAWAAEEGIEPAVLRQKVEEAMAGSAYRNEREPTVPALLTVIGILRRIPGFVDHP